MKPAKVDEVVNSMSSAPPSDKSSEEEEEKEEERVRGEMDRTLKALLLKIQDDDYFTRLEV